jgi:hypothetical protein
MQQSVLTLEYVKVPVSATSSGAVVNPTGDTVVMAFTVADVDPLVGDWKAATWETDATTDPTTYYARCLVGPAGTITLAVGVWDVWVKVTDAPEIPARRAGNLEIT